MARSMSPAREKEFEELVAFLDFHYEVFTKPKLPPYSAERPSLRSEVERIAREFGRSKALEGMRQAANDVLEELSDLTSEGVKLLDKALSEAGVITLSEMRGRYSALYQRVLRRGKIKTETEYYLVNGLVVDQTSALKDEEHRVLQCMISVYEG